MRALFALGPSEIAGLRAQSRGRPRSARLWVPVAAFLFVWLTMSPAPVRAVGALSAQDVTPNNGTPTTTFVFSVHYTSEPAERAESVSVSVAGLAPIPLTRTSGPAHNGTWQSAPVQLPAGSWTATFTALTQGEDDPAPVTVGPINVTQPTPTPAPTPTPPPTPTPRPTATPRPTRAPTPGPTPPPGVTPQPATPAPQPTPPGTGNTRPDPSATPRESELGGTPGQPNMSASEAENGAPTEGTGSPDPSAVASDEESPRGSMLAPFLIVGGTMSVAGAAVLTRQWYVTRRPK